MSFRPLAAVAAVAILGSYAAPVLGQVNTETIFQSIGADTRVVFPHTSVPGATGIDFSFFGGIDGGIRHIPPPAPESHVLVTVFEWGPTAIGPWLPENSSPDNVDSIPVETTTLISTGVYHGLADAPFVAIHFYAGNLMYASGTFTHLSVVPEPSTLAALFSLGASGLLALACWRRRGRKRRKP